MTARFERTRLAHFLAAYQPLDRDLEDRVWDRVYRAGWNPDDPVSLQIAHESIAENRMAMFAAQLESLPGQMAEAMRNTLMSVEKARKHAISEERQAIAERVALKAESVLRNSMPRLERQFQWRVVSRLTATTALIGLLFLGGGYVLGRHDTATLTSGYADLATQPDAETWLHLHAINGNLDAVISRNCQAGQQGHIVTASGQQACAIPLWIDAAAAPRPGGSLGKVNDYLVSLNARMPFSAIFGLGLLAGISLGPLLRRLKPRVAKA